jgi:cell division protein FtsI (penicillin-binding protein 3)
MTILPVCKTPEFVPDVKGMPGMDAIALLENLGIEVKVGLGKVKTQSLQAGQDIMKTQP